MWRKAIAWRLFSLSVVVRARGFRFSYSPSSKCPILLFFVCI